MEAIVLVGGLGTRLRPLTESVPKPMVDVAGRPFLEYVLDALVDEGVSRVCLAVGYKAEVVEQHFGSSYRGIPLVYSREETPLGTGGAIVRALDLVTSESVLVANGDTLFMVNLREMFKQHEDRQAKLTIAVKYMQNFTRYGSVLLDQREVVTDFEEKKPKAEGFINGGVYLLNRHTILESSLPEKFSFEVDFMERHCVELEINSYKSDGYFIDIGIPEDLERAQIEFMEKA